MTSVTKSILIAVVLLVCGLLIAACAFTLAGGSLSAFEVGVNAADLTEINQSYPASVQTIQTALAVTDLRVFRTAGTEITLRYYDDPENPYYTAECTGGVLSFHRSARKMNFFGISFSLGRSWTAELGIPETFSGSLDLSCSTGEIEIAGLDVAGDLVLKASTGSIHLEALAVSGKISAKVSTGGIRAENIQAAACTMTASTGKIRLETAKADTLDLSATTGEILVTNAAAEEIRFHTTTGDITAGQITVGRLMETTATTGDIECSLRNKSGEFTIESKTSTGDSNLPERFGTGEKTLYAKTSTGDIEFRFSD